MDSSRRAGEWFWKTCSVWDPGANSNYSSFFLSTSRALFVLISGYHPESPPVIALGGSGFMEAPVWRTQAILHAEALCADSWKPLCGGPRPSSAQRHCAPSSCYDSGGETRLKVGCQSCGTKKNNNNIIRKIRAQVISHFLFSGFGMFFIVPRLGPYRYRRRLFHGCKHIGYSNIGYIRRPRFSLAS